MDVGGGGGGTPTVSRVTDFHLSSPYGALCTRSGVNTVVLSQGVPNYRFYAGESVTFHARGWSEGANVRIQLTDGVTTAETIIAATGEFDDSVTLSVNAVPTKLTCSVTKDASVAGTTMIVSKCWFEPHQAIYRYPIPTGPQRITEVYIEDTVAGRFDALIPPRWWYIEKEQRQLVFVEDFFTPETGRALHLVCQGTPQIPSADTDNMPVDSEYLIMQARQYLLESLPWHEDDAKQYRSRYDRDGATLRRMEEAWASRMRDEPGSIAIEVI